MGFIPAGTRVSRRLVWGRSSLLTDISVAVLFVAGWVTVLDAPSHLAVGLLFVAIAVVHLGTRPRLVAKLRRGTGASVVSWTAIVAAVVMTVSGVVQWAGVRAMMPVHSTSSYLVLLALIVHVWQRRRALVARLRRDRARRREPA